MTATTTRLTIPRRRSANAALRRLVGVLRSAGQAAGAAWSAFAESGQLGPDAEMSVGRHTGARV